MGTTNRFLSKFSVIASIFFFSFPFISLKNLFILNHQWLPGLLHHFFLMIFFLIPIFIQTSKMGIGLYGYAPRKHTAITFIWTWTFGTYSVLKKARPTRKHDHSKENSNNLQSIKLSIIIWIKPKNPLIKKDSQWYTKNYVQIDKSSTVNIPEYCPQHRTSKRT